MVESKLEQKLVKLAGKETLFKNIIGKSALFGKGLAHGAKHPIKLTKGWIKTLVENKGIGGAAKHLNVSKSDLGAYLGGIGTMAAAYPVAGYAAGKAVYKGIKRKKND